MAITPKKVCDSHSSKSIFRYYLTKLILHIIREKRYKPND